MWRRTLAHEYMYINEPNFWSSYRCLLVRLYISEFFRLAVR